MNTDALKKRWEPEQRRFFHISRRFAVERLGRWPNRPKILANSVPKSGTNLLRRGLELLPGIMDSDIYLNRPRDLTHLEQTAHQVYRGCFLRGHVPYTAEYQTLLDGLGFRTLLMIRDPRDVAVSLLHWVTYKHKTHRLHPYFSSLENDSDRLMQIIRGVPAQALNQERGLENARDYTGAFLPWIEHGSCLIRFEDLIGERGGGSVERQTATLQTLVGHLGLSLTPDNLKTLQQSMYNPQGHTFRKGKIGDWRNHLSPEHQDAFKEVAGQLLIDLSYEKDTNW